MAKVRSTMTLIRDDGPFSNGWELKVMAPESLKQQCVDKFIRSDEVQSIILEVEVRAPYVEKTLSQLGYLHAAVWPVFYQYYRDQGIQVETKEQMEKVRDEVKDVIGFTDYINSGLFHKGVTHRPKSFASTSKEETSEAIDQIIRLAADFGMIVPGPEEYLEKHNAKEFE